MSKDEKELQALANEIEKLSYEVKKAVDELFSLTGKLNRLLFLTKQKKTVVKGYVPKGKSYL